MNSLDVLKIIVLFALFILTFLLGLLPIRLIRKKPSSGENAQLLDAANQRPNLTRVISFLSCLAAGVFLATCLLDLLPIVRRLFMDVLDQMKIAIGFPLAEFVMLLGLFSILTTEQVVLKIREGTTKDCLRTSRYDQGQSQDQKGEEFPMDSSLRKETTLDGVGQGGSPNGGQRGQIMSGCDGHLNGQKQPDRHQEEDEHYSEIAFGFDDSESVKSPEGSDLREQPKTHSSLRAYFLLFSLSLHSVFEGLAIGLQQKDIDVLDVFAALLIHKCILSFSLGLKLAQTAIPTKSVAFSVLFFSVTAPIGVGIGTGIVSLSSSVVSRLVQGILQGLACGTFLYITFFEVLPNEFNSHENRMVKLAFVFLGYCLVTGLLFLGDDVWTPFCAAPPKDRT